MSKNKTENNKTEDSKKEELIETLFNLGAHLGHRKNRVHPKSKKFIYTFQNGQSIIDLAQTVDYLFKAKEFVKKLAKEKKTLLVVCTKKIASNQVTKICQENGVNYLTIKWPAGFLTNFETIYKNINNLKKLIEEKETGLKKALVKHEKVKLEKRIRKIENLYQGVLNLEKIPDALFIIDIKKEKNAVIEALKVGIPTIAIADTNVDPDLVTYPIPANDDLLSSIEYIVKEIVQAYASAKK
ncbi:MAG: 30S ribosomal protein S2 [Microgenomates group bacterium]